MFTYIYIYQFSYSSSSKKENKTQDKCQTHSKHLNYFCVDCKVHLCQHCIVYNRHDTSHLIAKTQELKQGPIKDLYDKSLQLEDILSNIDEHLPETIEAKINELQTSKENTITYYKQLLSALDKRYTEMITELTLLKTSLTPQISEYKQQHETALDMITDLIYHSKQTQTYKNKDVIAFLNNNKDTITANDFNKYCNLVHCVITPPMQMMPELTFTYELRNYKEMVTKKEQKYEMITTPLYRVNFLSWELHIYPWGSRSVKDKYISVFIGLRDGKDNVEYNYNYKFSLINFKGKSAHCSELGDKAFIKKGSFYGSEKFFDIDKIESEGYINDEGSVIIKCYLCPKEVDVFVKEMEYYNKINNK